MSNEWIVNNSIVITNHGLQTGDTIVYSSSPNIPVSPLVNNDEYFVERIDSNNIRLYDDYTLTTVITVSSSSTGSHSITYRPITIGTDGFNIRNHGFDTGDSLEVELASGVIPEGLVNGQRLFVGSVGVNSFTLHSVRADALNSVNGLTQTPVNISNVGSAAINLIKNNVKVIDAFNSSSSKPEAYSTLTTSNIDAANIISGTVNPGRLASAGIANTDTYLRGDSTWATAVSSLELETGTPLNVVGSFDSDSTGTFYFGAVKLSIDTVDPDEGNPNFTNTGVVSLFKQQFDVTDSGEVSIKDGVVDAGQLGGQLPSYYLDPANLLQEVAVSKNVSPKEVVVPTSVATEISDESPTTAIIQESKEPITTQELIDIEVLPEPLPAFGLTARGSDNNIVFVFEKGISFIKNTSTLNIPLPLNAFKNLIKDYLIQYPQKEVHIISSYSATENFITPNIGKQRGLQIKNMLIQTGINSSRIVVKSNIEDITFSSDNSYSNAIAFEFKPLDKKRIASITPKAIKIPKSITFYPTFSNTNILKTKQKQQQQQQE